MIHNPSYAADSRFADAAAVLRRRGLPGPGADTLPLQLQQARRPGKGSFMQPSCAAWTSHTVSACMKLYTHHDAQRKLDVQEQQVPQSLLASKVANLIASQLREDPRG